MADNLNIKSSEGAIDLIPQSSTTKGGSVNFHFAGTTDITAYIAELQLGILSLKNTPVDTDDSNAITTTSWVRRNCASVLPSQTDNATKVMTTNGEVVSWTDLIITVASAERPDDSTATIGTSYIDLVSGKLYTCTRAPEQATLAVNTEPEDATVSFDVDESTATGAAEYTEMEFNTNRLYYVESTGISYFWNGTALVEISSSSSATQVVFSVKGTTAVDTNTINLGTALQDVTQILYVNLDMAIALPNAYELSSDGINLVFTETLVAGTNYCIAYVKNVADLSALPAQEILSISGTTAEETSQLEIGEAISKNQVVSVNLGNTLLLHDLYDMVGTALVLHEPIPANLNWNIRYLKQTNIGAAYVDTDNAQTINGEKTFTTSPLVPTVSNSDISDKAISSNYINNKFKVVSELPETPDENTFYFIY